MTSHVTFSLRSDDNSEQIVECRCDGHPLQVRADGYGNSDDLVRLEHRDGRLVLLVWADVNDDQPTHVIDLESAGQQHRNEVIAEAKKRLRTEKLTNWKEAELFMRVYQCINWRTGKEFTMREAAEELNVEYARFRNNLMLAMPYDGPSISDEDRKRLLEAPITPSAGLIALLRRRPTAGGDR
jgi:hypothetical protein